MGREADRVLEILVETLREMMFCELSEYINTASEKRPKNKVI